MVTKSEVKYIQSLAHKKFRDEEKLFVLEGVKIVGELLKEFPHRVKKLFALESWVATHASIVPSSVEVVAVLSYELEKISFLQHPNEVLVLVDMPAVRPAKPMEHGITLVLDQLQDPGNLGTIIRTCDWFGVKQIICSVDTVDAFNPKVVQAAMGSIMRIDIIYTDLADFCLSSKGVPIYAAVLHGESVFKTSFLRPCFLLIGNESKGISDALLSMASNTITIPQIGAAESLNAAVATGIILAEMSAEIT
jgi:TrmH family RNA methyltransferase